MKRLWVFFPVLLFLTLGCNNVMRVQVEVLRPPRLNVNFKKLSLVVVQKKLRNEFVEIRDFKEEVRKFIKNELETETNIQVVDEKDVPHLRVEYSASLSKAYSFYNPRENLNVPEATAWPTPSSPGVMVPVKIISMKMCFEIKEIKYRKCFKERMHFPSSESSVFALYAVLQRMTSSFLADISYQRKKVMHYLLR